MPVTLERSSPGTETARWCRRPKHRFGRLLVNVARSGEREGVVDDCALLHDDENIIIPSQARQFRSRLGPRSESPPSV